MPRRLNQIVRKVPKEQNTSVEVGDGKSIELKMRVFVVNSEDAKAVGDYINNHLDQVMSFATSSCPSSLAI